VNTALADAFRNAANGLLFAFGRPVAWTHGAETTVIQAIIEQGAEQVGDYGERSELQWSATLNQSDDVQVGDVLAFDGARWKLSQRLDSDGFVQRFALRAVIE
jgi:hypothetical protein